MHFEEQARTAHLRDRDKHAAPPTNYSCSFEFLVVALMFGFRSLCGALLALSAVQHTPCLVNNNNACHGWPEHADATYAKTKN
jgi:hypothetical protein